MKTYASQNRHYLLQQRAAGGIAFVADTAYQAFITGTWYGRIGDLNVELHVTDYPLTSIVRSNGMLAINGASIESDAVFTGDLEIREPVKLGVGSRVRMRHQIQGDLHAPKITRIVGDQYTLSNGKTYGRDALMSEAEWLTK